MRFDMQLATNDFYHPCAPGFRDLVGQNTSGRYGIKTGYEGSGNIWNLHQGIGIKEQNNRGSGIELQKLQESVKLR